MRPLRGPPPPVGVAKSKEALIKLSIKQKILHMFQYFVKVNRDEQGLFSLFKNFCNSSSLFVPESKLTSVVNSSC